MKNSALPNELVRVALRYYEGLGTPKSLSAAVMLRCGDWDGLARLSADPRSYADSASYYRDACAVSFLKKLQQLPGDDGGRKSRAIEKWWQGERDCYLSNQRLTRYLPKRGFPAFSDVDRGISEFFSDVRKIIFD